ncbi:myosin phosphatase Rho-interacting protein-like [Diretmus argenteus]
MVLWEELCSFQREIEVLSEQYSQKCLENAHLAQALEAERQALRQCQRENQELNAHNQELNNRLAAEITKMRSMTSEDGDSSATIQGKELYELEVTLLGKHIR